MTTKKVPGYRELNDELEAILADLQTDELDVDKAIAKYERGMEIVKQLEEYLQKAENKVKAVKAALD